MEHNRPGPAALVFIALLSVVLLGTMSFLVAMGSDVLGFH
jgi:hypothetical protein